MSRHRPLDQVAQSSVQPALE